MVAPGASSSAPVEIDDGVAEIARGFPLGAGGARVGGEESEVHALELLGADALDKGHLVADRLELAEGLVVIEQADIDGGEIAVAQDFGDFFSHERGRADDGDAIEVGSRAGRPARRRTSIRAWKLGS